MEQPPQEAVPSEESSVVDGAEEAGEIESASLETESDLAKTREGSKADSNSDSNASSSESDSDSSDDEDMQDIAKAAQQMQNNNKADEDEDAGAGIVSEVPRTKNEILPEELPVESVAETVVKPDARIVRVGHIRSIMGNTLVIQSTWEPRPLDHGSLMCCGKKALDASAATPNATSISKTKPESEQDTVIRACSIDAQVLGKVDEIFGPVSSPLYVVRVDENRANTLLPSLSSDDNSPGGRTVVYAVDELSTYVSMMNVNQKGSDASNMYDEEPAEDEVQDFSDDEAEAAAKMKRRKAKQAERGDKGQGTNNAREKTDRRRRVVPKRNRGKHYNFANTHQRAPPNQVPPSLFSVAGANQNTSQIPTGGMQSRQGNIPPLLGQPMNHLMPPHTFHNRNQMSNVSYQPQYNWSRNPSQLHNLHNQYQQHMGYVSPHYQTPMQQQQQHFYNAPLQPTPSLTQGQLQFPQGPPPALQAPPTVTPSLVDHRWVQAKKR